MWLGSYLCNTVLLLDSLETAKLYRIVQTLSSSVNKIRITYIAFGMFLLDCWMNQLGIGNLIIFVEQYKSNKSFDIHLFIRGMVLY